jgi:hypothetical protein
MNDLEDLDSAPKPSEGAVADSQETYRQACEQIKRENRRRADLNEAAAKGRLSGDPTERAKWLARDEALTRGFVSPDGGL